MVKTIEMIFGVEPMSVFDLIANDMRASFQNAPNALNGQQKQDAIASSKMDWKEPDDVPTEQLNAILWRNSNKTEYPVWKKQSAVFEPATGR